MFRRRLTLVLGLIATVVVMAALLAALSLVAIERQVVRGRVASDIATAFIQLSAQKQRLRTWVAQMQQGGHADFAARSELLAALNGTLQKLKVLVQQAIELDGSSEAREEHLRRTEAGQVLPLTAKELALLELMMSSSGRLLSRERILSNVWGVNEDPLTNVVDVYIRRLRNKIDEGHDQPLIHTVRGLGYRLEALPD